MKPTIAIVGASARAAAASAVRAGFQPITADLFADADLRQIATATRISPYPEGFLDWLRVIEPPGWMYTGALENHPELIDQMAWVAPLWGNPGDVLERVRSPQELRQALAGAGLLFPETRDSAEGLPRYGSWLVKTYRGASGSGVREWRGQPATMADESTDSSDESLSVRKYYQQRTSGIPCAAAFVEIDGAVELLGVTRQLIGEPWLGAHGFQYAGSIGPLPIGDAVLDTIKRIGQAVSDRFELSGLFGVDFILDGDAVWTVEVNPRDTASMEICERATGEHTIALHLAGRHDAPVDSLRACQSVSKLAYGKAIPFAKKDVVITEAFAKMALAEAVRVPWPTLADISPPGTFVEAGRPIITVFAEGTDVDQVEQRLRERVAEIEDQVYDGEVAT